MYPSGYLVASYLLCCRVCQSRSSRGQPGEFSVLALRLELGESEEARGSEEALGRPPPPRSAASIRFISSASTVALVHVLRPKGGGVTSEVGRQACFVCVLDCVVDGTGVVQCVM